MPINKLRQPGGGDGGGGGGGGYTGLCSDCTLTRWSLSWFPIADCALRFRSSTLMIVPIKFWRNSGKSKKKEHFSSSKTDKVFAFLHKSIKFLIENRWKVKQFFLKHSVD